MLLLSAPNLAGNEWKYVKDCLDTGWVSSVGSYVNQFEQMVAEFTGVAHAVATSSGTTALHISLILQEVQPSDYVILPNITFVASANSIRYMGASPLLMDVHPRTWQMDLDLLEEFLEKETETRDEGSFVRQDGRRIGAIMPVHVLGNICDMERLMSLAIRYRIPVVEDATEALGSYWNGRHAGSFGVMGCLSFNGNKIITTGGGGMILTNDEGLARHAKHLTTQAKADPFEYFHDEVGYNYRLVNISAAMGVAQMEQLPGFLERKVEIDRFYKENLGGIGDIAFQGVLPGASPNYWLFTFQTERQRAVLGHLNSHNLQSRPFWVPMNQLPMYRHERYLQRHDHSDAVYRSAISIPCSTNITDEQLGMVVERIKEVYA